MTRDRLDSTSASESSISSAAWGLRLIGVPGASAVLSAGSSLWPEMRVRVRAPDESEDKETAHLSDKHCRLDLLGGGSVWLTRDPLEATLTLPQAATVLDECVVQPHLASAASVAGAWLGRDVFHAGAIVVDGQAWGLLAGKEGGKSTTLAHMFRRGVHVLTDDALVIEDGRALAGPRCVDLRPQSAQALSVGRPLGVVGTRERWRVYVGECEASYPLGGWVLLEWAPLATATPVPSRDRLDILLRHRALPLPWVAAPVFLQLVARPMLRWSRPQALDAMDGSLPPLLAALGRLTTSGPLPVGEPW